MSNIIYTRRAEFKDVFNLAVGRIEELYELFQHFTQQYVLYQTFDEYNTMRLVMNYYMKESDVKEREYSVYLSTRDEILKSVFTESKSHSAYLNRNILIIDQTLEIKVDPLFVQHNQEAFQAMDIDKDGKITFDDMMYGIFVFPYEKVTMTQFALIINVGTVPPLSLEKYVCFYLQMTGNKIYFKLTQLSYVTIQAIISQYTLAGITVPDITDHAIIIYNDSTPPAPLPTNSYYYTYFKAPSPKIPYSMVIADKRIYYGFFEYMVKTLGI